MDSRHDQITRSGDTEQQQFSWLTALFRVRPVILLIAGIITGWSIYNHLKQRTAAVDPASEFRMPITNSPLEPDRPDLIGEPRIDE